MLPLLSLLTQNTLMVPVIILLLMFPLSWFIFIQSQISIDLNFCNDSHLSKLSFYSQVTEIITFNRLPVAAHSSQEQCRPCVLSFLKLRANHSSFHFSTALDDQLCFPGCHVELYLALSLHKQDILDKRKQTQVTATAQIQNSHSKNIISP